MELPISPTSIEKGLIGDRITGVMPKLFRQLFIRTGTLLEKLEDL